MIIHLLCMILKKIIKWPSVIGVHGLNSMYSDMSIPYNDFKKILIKNQKHLKEFKLINGFDDKDKIEHIANYKYNVLSFQKKLDGDKQMRIGDFEEPILLLLEVVRKYQNYTLNDFCKDVRNKIIESPLVTKIDSNTVDCTPTVSEISVKKRGRKPNKELYTDDELLAIILKDTSIIHSKNIIPFLEMTNAGQLKRIIIKNYPDVVFNNKENARSLVGYLRDCLGMKKYSRVK